jgi:hypothetical protein
MKNILLIHCIIASIIVSPVRVARAEEGKKISLESGMDFNTGRYGGSQSTGIFYVPVTGKYQGDTWTLKLTVPYLQITGPGDVISVLNGVGPTASAANGATVTRSGLGDVIATATHNTYVSRSSEFLVKLTGKVKFGTASRANGLGTGENDYAFQSELYRITGRLTTFGTLGFKVYGSPAGTAYRLNNGFFGSLGSSYKFRKDASGGLMLNLGQKITTAGSPHVEAIFFAGNKLDNDWKVRGYVLKGMTKSVPSWGAGATVAYLF